MVLMNVHQAKSQLSKLLDAAERGEDVYVTRRGSRFQIVPAPETAHGDLFGILRHELTRGEPDYEAADRALDEIVHEFNEELEKEQ